MVIPEGLDPLPTDWNRRSILMSYGTTELYAHFQEKC